MNSQITNAAGIYVQEPIDNTYTSGGGATAVGGTVVVADKGRVGTILQVLDKNWQKQLGKPLPKKKKNMEGLRHLAEAAKECNYVNVVRVVAKDAKYPLLTLRRAVDRGAWVAGTEYVVGDIVHHSDGVTLLRVVQDHTALQSEPSSSAVDENYGVFFKYAGENKGNWAAKTAYVVGELVKINSTLVRCIKAHTSGDSTPELDELGDNWIKFNLKAPIENYFDADAKPYDTDVLNGDDDLMLIRPIDGDPSKNRSLRVEELDEVTKRFKLSILDKNELGELFVLESFVVGIDPDDKDDMGAPAFIETVFENQSNCFRVDWNDEYGWDDAIHALRAVESEDLLPSQMSFSGGTNGGEPTVDDWKTAWNLLRNEDVPVQLLFAAGNYDPNVIQHVSDIADTRHCSFDFDAPPYLNRAGAEKWVKDLGLKSRHTRCYHSPFKSNDPWRGGKTVWSASGGAVAAKARCNSQFTGVVPNVHKSHAGEKRGFLDRTGVTPLFPDSELDRLAFYKARINPIVPSKNGGVIIDDCLTMHYQENYSRFGWINDILDYIDHIFVEVAAQAQHEADADTAYLLNQGMKEKLDQLVVSGALVPPRNPAVDGDKPYVLTVKQEGIDIWSTQWDVCPTGSARRINGQPRIVK